MSAGAHSRINLRHATHVCSLTNIKAVHTKEDRGIGTALLESAYRFTLGSIAGATGASAVYPIGKRAAPSFGASIGARIQIWSKRECKINAAVPSWAKWRTRTRWTASKKSSNSKASADSRLVSMPLFSGVLGLYRGLLPQIVGVAPEKASK